MIDVEKLSKRASGPELFLLQAQQRSHLGAVGFGLAAGVLVFALQMLPMLAFAQPLLAMRENLDGALFFGLSIGVLAGCTGPVFRGASADVTALTPVLPLNALQLSQVQLSMTREPLTETLLWSAIGLGCAAVHGWIMGLHELPLPFLLSNALGTALLWVAMWWTVPPLLGNAQTFNQLGTIASPDLLRPSRHAAFGRAALRPALFIIALLCVYPLLAFGDGLRGPVMMGFSVTLASLFGLFFLPLRGIRGRIGTLRTETLAELDCRADALFGVDIASADAERLFEIDAVLDIRERVARVSSWPLDLQGVRRILLYVVLPPLTWAAAALLEMYLEQSL